MEQKEDLDEGLESGRDYGVSKESVIKKPESKKAFVIAKGEEPIIMKPESKKAFVIDKGEEPITGIAPQSGDTRAVLESAIKTLNTGTAETKYLGKQLEDFFEEAFNPLQLSQRAQRGTQEYDRYISKYMTHLGSAIRDLKGKLLTQAKEYKPLDTSKPVLLTASVVSKLDKIASVLEGRGYTKLAEEIDVLTNTIEKYLSE